MFHGRKKIARGNQIPFITKDLSKGMIKGSKLRNRHWKNRGPEKRIRCTQQRNSCLSFLRKTKIRQYGNQNEQKSLIINTFGR